MRTRGELVSEEVLEGEAKKQALEHKLVEELEELLDATELSAEHFADVQQTLEDLLWEHGYTRDDIRLAQERKRQEHGDFRAGRQINWVGTTDPEWIRYYEDNADRYPEIDPPPE